MKRSFFRTLLLIPVLTLLSACQNPPPSQDSCNFVLNSLNRRVSWARTPIQFYIDAASFEGPDELKYHKAIQEAMDVWNAEFETPVFELVGVTTALPAPRIGLDGRVTPDTFNAIYSVEKSVFENTSMRDEQARTSISYVGDFISEADILIDGSERFYFEDQAISASQGLIQFKSLMIHEFGHVLGLGHVDDPSVNSVMYPRLQYGQMRPAPLLVASSSGEEQVTFLLPEVDRNSLSCEY